MRLIKEEVAAEIMKYDNYIISEVDWNNRTEANRIDYYKQLRFDLFEVKSIIDPDQPVLLPATETIVNKVAGALYQIKRISETCRESGDSAKVKASNLLVTISEKYRIH